MCVPTSQFFCSCVQNFELQVDVLLRSIDSFQTVLHESIVYNVLRSYKQHAWVSAEHAIPVDIHLYDRLFTHPSPAASSDGGSYREFMNPDSLRTLTQCVVELSLQDARPGDRFQFEREGYFCLDPQSSADRMVFNRTVTLRDSWAKVEQQYR